MLSLFRTAINTNSYSIFQKIKQITNSNVIIGTLNKMK